MISVNVISRLMVCIAISVIVSGCIGAGMKPVQMKDKPLDRPLSINTRPRILAIGHGFSVGIKKDGTVWSWGSNFRDAYLGRPTSTEKEALEPGQIGELRGALSVVASSSHALVLMKDGTVWSWGENDHGQLGYTTKERYSGTPQQIPGLTEVVDIAAQWGVSQVLKNDGTVWGFGWGVSGRLGKTALEGNNQIMQINALKNIARIEIGRAVAMAIDKEGKLWTYGADEQRQGRPLGIDPKEVALTPGVVMLPRRVVDVSANAHAVYALLEDGTVWSWGHNNAGQLGTGEKNERGRSLPARISSLSSIVMLASGMGGAVVADDGTIATWGTAAGGTPRDMKISNLPTPYALTQKLAASVLFLVGGGAYAVVDANGDVWFWQTNSRGERGTGTTVGEPSVKYWTTLQKSHWIYD